MPLIRIRDLKGGRDTETRYSGEYDTTYIVRSGDLLIGMDGEFGCYQWNGQDALLNQRVCRIFVTSQDLDQRFLFYGINRHLKLIEDRTNFTTVKHLSSKQILEIEFAYPPLPEQKRIVAILDEAFDGIAKATANAERNLINAEDLFKSRSSHLFSNPNWTVCSVEEAVEDDCTLSYGIVQPGEEFDDGLPIVRPKDLGARMIALDGLKRIDPELAKAYSRTTLKGGDILLCVRGETGIVAIADAELRGANVTRGIVPIRFDSRRFDADFGYYALKSPAVQRQIKAATYGAALMQINIRDLRKISICAPPLAQQRALAGELVELEAMTQALATRYAQAKRSLDTLRQSLLTKAFSGGLGLGEPIAA